MMMDNDIKDGDVGAVNKDVSPTSSHKSLMEYCDEVKRVTAPPIRSDMAIGGKQNVIGVINLDAMYDVDDELHRHSANGLL
jgi:hypothetical protein